MKTVFIKILVSDSFFVVVVFRFSAQVQEVIKEKI